MMDGQQGPAVAISSQLQKTPTPPSAPVSNNDNANENRLLPSPPGSGNSAFSSPKRSTSLPEDLLLHSSWAAAAAAAAAAGASPQPTFFPRTGTTADVDLLEPRTPTASATTPQTTTTTTTVVSSIGSLLSSHDLLIAAATAVSNEPHRPSSSHNSDDNNNDKQQEQQRSNPHSHFPTLQPRSSSTPGAMLDSGSRVAGRALLLGGDDPGNKSPEDEVMTVRKQQEQGGEEEEEEFEPVQWDPDAPADSNNNDSNNNNNNMQEGEENNTTVEGDGFGAVWKAGERQEEEEHHHDEKSVEEEQDEDDQSPVVVTTVNEEYQTEEETSSSDHQPPEQQPEEVDSGRDAAAAATATTTTSAAPCAPMMDADTPVVSNNHKQNLVRKSIENVLTSTLNRHALPSADVVTTSVSTSVNQALDRLKHFATPYVSRAMETGGGDSSNIPEVLNTSTESSNNDDDDDDDDVEGQQSIVSSALTTSEPSDAFDLKELEAELRSRKSKTAVKAAASERDGKNDDAVRDKPPQQRGERIVSPSTYTSYDTIGQPKPPDLAGSSLPPPTHAQKPVAVSASPDRPSKSGSPTPSLPGNLVTDTSARAVTPIMRMRHPATRKATTISEEDSATRISAARSTTTKTTRSEEEYKAIKQKQWKEKMKMIGRRREEERSLLEDGEEEDGPRTPNSRRSSSRRQRKGNKARRAARPVIDSFPSCQSEVTKIIERFVRNRCGGIDDIMFEDDEEEESVSRFSAGESESSESDDDETATDSEGGSSFEEKHRTTTTTNSAAQNGKVNSKSIEVTSDRAVSEPGVKDKTFIKSFISQVTKKGMEVMLHRKHRGKSLNGPNKVNSSIVPGTQNKLRGFSGPKFVWESIEGGESGEIDLFDIGSLDKATVLQLQEYPLAMPGRSIFIRLNRGAEYVFEALTDDDALRFIHGMRWVIARLAFNLIIGNLGVSCELLDVERSGDPESEGGRFPKTLKQEAKWTKAMNDVTCHLVDKADLP